MPTPDVSEAAGPPEPPPADRYSVCLLFYGDHETLARRCLGSLVPFLGEPNVADVRVALNTVSRSTRDYVLGVMDAIPVPALVVETGANPGKYPLMRRLFYGEDVPAFRRLAPLVMWFDDDSYVLQRGPGFFSLVSSRLLVPGVGQVGECWYVDVSPGQAAAVGAQPWYRKHPPVGPSYRHRFATGGWWAARSQILRQWDYPFPELHHNGGDTALGHLMTQQGYEIIDFRGIDQVKVNNAPRRGLSMAPLWWNYRPGQRPDLTHQHFPFEVTRSF